MSNSISAIAQHLGHAGRKQVAQSLADTNQLATLCDMIDSLEADIVAGVYPAVYRFCLAQVTSKNDVASILRACTKIPRLSQDMLTHIVDGVLVKYIQESFSSKFLSNFATISQKYAITGDFEGGEVSDEHVLSYLHFLEKLFMNNTDLQADSRLDKLLCFYMCVADSTISTTASQILRWRIAQIMVAGNEEFIWDVVFALRDSDLKYHQHHSYVLWLRYLSLSAGDLINNTFFQNLLTQESYWARIQAGLIASHHEHRKFALSILQLSVKAINTDIANDLLVWKVLDEPACERKLTQWSRYTTLYEVMAIDTSLHQSQAAQSEIIEIISSQDSEISSSWGVVLLSTAFKATMESVRKFGLSVLLTIPKHNLGFLGKNQCETNLRLLREVFLPYMMLAHHFKVTTTQDTLECEYGVLFAEFIENLVVHLTDEQDISRILDILLEVLAGAREAYDPTRAYMTQGIVQSLHALNRPILTASHLERCLKLYEVSAESQVIESMLQITTLETLFYQKDSSLLRFWEIVTKFVQFNNAKSLANGYSLIHANKERLVSCLVSTFTAEDFNRALAHATTLEVEGTVLFVTFATYLGYPLDYAAMKTWNTYELVVSELMVSSCDEAVITPFLEDYANYVLQPLLRNEFLGSAEKTLSVYTRLANVQDRLKVLRSYLTTAGLQAVWNSLLSDLKNKSSPDEASLRLVDAKLQFFAACTQYFDHTLVSFITMDVLVAFNELQVPVLLNCGGINYKKDFYKVKDSFLSGYYRLLLANITSETPPKLILDILEHNLNKVNDYQSNLMICSLVEKLSRSNIYTATEASRTIILMSGMWDNLLVERLVLTQKDLHLLFIKTVFSVKNMHFASRNPEIATTLLNISQTLIEKSYARRSLLPTLTKQLLHYLLSNPVEFDGSEWIGYVIVDSYILQQLSLNVFKLEIVIGDAYDVLVKPKTRLYESMYGDEEIATRINILAMLSSLEQGSRMSLQIYHYIFSGLFDMIAPVKRTDGGEEIKRIQLYSILLLVLRNIEDAGLVNATKFLDALQKEPSPLARIYLEWIIASQFLKTDEVCGYSKEAQKILHNLSNDSITPQPTLIISYERILFMMGQQLSLDQETAFMSEFLHRVVLPLCSTNKALIRHFSLSLMCSIHPEITSKGLKIDDHLLTIVHSLYDSTIHSEAFGQFRSGDALLWNIKDDLSLVGLAGGVLLRVSDRDVDSIGEAAFARYLKEERVRKSLKVSIGKDLSAHWVKVAKNALDPAATTKDGSRTEQSPMQTKSGAWNTIMNVDGVADGQRVSSSIKRSDLIVVASLVDKPPNLGGICRLSDVLGAGLLTLDDYKVTKHPQFKNVAVTADQWMPMTEVKAKDIISFMKTKKKEGYTLIGLEQTDKSVQLNSDLKFPQKSLILLGREREGIPGDCLAELDFCVEIKQVGVIRSMNIQTATAVIVHAYTSQHC
ncbi:hypothetical protein BABINDRAFT_160926 [Babjeviella inositovora NRRL Y-12698]|uniref:tRNA/rRNA methyltransferase SpoU type domain-containing protein n=1 Tax=Babjeviella inositovora NRRL Y-12698 TaxID=984486 RepID=A0A1E3QSM7_9ASCO|nr:uncharacterized protein BABINDRAFT_160926 [Babjeviella inositovora NRRL Y-12698]ODQ80691.1 hypothetical protein BABINDRAFT_160926 [Babjeviella inositovora NRRL Y-12698]